MGVGDQDWAVYSVGLLPVHFVLIKDYKNFSL